MQVVHDDYLVDHWWIVTFHHHLDDRLSLHHVWHVSDDSVTSIHIIHCSVVTVAIVHDAREPTTVCAIHKTIEAWRCSVFTTLQWSCSRHKTTTIRRR